ncbi:MAG: SCO family protein [Sulfuritalea sp.]|nr:SCO family protein [Sulfuritalea sp.]
MKTAALTAAWIVLAGLVPAAHAVELDEAARNRSVDSLGRINGQALACGYLRLSHRVRTIVIARLPKTREIGERFERATGAAFLAQGAAGASCPQEVALTIEADSVARPLGTPPTHSLANVIEPPAPDLNPRYLLQATHGRAISDGDFPRHFQLIAFGYTFCPDICPTTLLEMAEVMKLLDANALHLQPIFISVDPERDSLPQLRDYLKFFDSRIVGATGSPELVRRAAENFKVRYERVAAPGAGPLNYAVDHSAGMYLLAPGGRFVAKFPYGMAAAEIAARVGEAVENHFPKQSRQPNR